MGRNCIRRQIGCRPLVTGFKPLGRIMDHRKRVVISLDEFEVIRLLDYLHMNQVEASEQMKISRPTLTRIYEKARIRFATALVEGIPFIIEGGDVQVADEMRHCPHCRALLEDGAFMRHQCRKRTDAELEDVPAEENNQEQQHKERSMQDASTNRIEYPRQRCRRRSNDAMYLHNYPSGHSSISEDAVKPDEAYEYTLEAMNERKQQLEKELQWLDDRIKEWRNE